MSITSIESSKREGMLTLADLAKRWKCSKQHARNLVDSGRAPAGVKLGRLRRFRVSEIECWEREGCPDLRAIA